MKFFKNIIILLVSTVFLSFIIIRLASISSGNIRYIFFGCFILLLIVFNFLMDLNFFVSIKEYSKLSSKEMVNKSVQMERRYVGEIICFVVGSVLLYFGFFYNKEIVFNNIILSPIIFILSGIFFIITVFVGLFNKKERIENLLNHAETTKSKIKEYQKAGICGVITLSLADYLYKALELSINVGILLGVVAILVSLIYLFYLLKKPTNI